MFAILGQFDCLQVEFIYIDVSLTPRLGDTMPPRRLARAKQLITACIRLGRAKAKRVSRRTAILRNLSARNDHDLDINEDPNLTDGLSELSKISSFKELTPDEDMSNPESSSSSSSSSEDWMSEAASEEATSDDNEMCSLVGIGEAGWMTDDDSDLEDDMDCSVSDFDAGNEGDDEEEEETDLEWDGLDDDVGQRHGMHQWVRAEIEGMYASRYEVP
jgi:hypothetical protein